MEKEQLIDFIKQNIPNISVTKMGLETIAAHFEEIEFSKNEYLLKQGKVSGYYYLAEGFVRAFTHDIDGNEITTFFIPEAGSHLKPLLSFSINLPRSTCRQLPTAKYMPPTLKS